MQLFYSGAETVNGYQPDMYRSLGGTISGTIVPNGRINSLFQDTSQNSLETGYSETKAIFLKNTTGKVIKNVLVYYNYGTGTESKLEVAFAAPNTNSQIEVLRSSKELPYNATFVEANVVYSSTTLQILKNFQPNEIVFIDHIEIDLSPNPTTAEFISKLLTACITDPLYSAVQLDTKTVQLTYREIGVYTNTPLIIAFTSGAVVAEPFGGGVDNSMFVFSGSNYFQPNQIMGIWIKKTVTSTENTPYGLSVNDGIVVVDNSILFSQNTITPADSRLDAAFLAFQANSFNPLPKNNLEQTIFSIAYDFYITP